LVFKKDFENSPHPILRTPKSRKATFTDVRKLRREQAKKYSQSKAYSFVGSPHYMAPEILRKQGYAQLVDWWSIGCILYEMLVGFPPFGGDTPQDVFNTILDHQENLQFPPDDEDEEFRLSNDAKKCIIWFLSEPDNRLGRGGFEEIKKHPFFKLVQWESLRSMQPPFVPQLSSEIDTTYFDTSIKGKDSLTLEMDTINEHLKDPKRKRSGSFDNDFFGFTFKPSAFINIEELRREMIEEEKEETHS